MEKTFTVEDVARKINAEFFLRKGETGEGEGALLSLAHRFGRQVEERVMELERDDIEGERDESNRA